MEEEKISSSFSFSNPSFSSPHLHYPSEPLDDLSALSNAGKNDYDYSHHPQLHPHHLDEWEENFPYPSQPSELALYNLQQCVPGVLRSISDFAIRLLLYSLLQRSLYAALLICYPVRRKRGRLLADLAVGMAGVAMLYHEQLALASNRENGASSTGNQLVVLASYLALMLPILLLHQSTFTSNTFATTSTPVAERQLQKRRQCGYMAVAVTLGYTLSCQFLLLTDEQFTSVRGSLMIAAMKLISLAFDIDRGECYHHLEGDNNGSEANSNSLGKPAARKKFEVGEDDDLDRQKRKTRNAHGVVGSSSQRLAGAIFAYVFNPATLHFGPFVTFSQFTSSGGSLEEGTTTTSSSARLLLLLKNFIVSVLSSLHYAAFSLLFLLASSCLFGGEESPLLLLLSTPISDTSNAAALPQVVHRLLRPLARLYLTAASYRFGHYFVCYMAQASATMGGVEVGGLVSRWTRIEWPRSMTDVVVHWNWPMHTFLHKYVFTESKQRRGYSAAMFSTFAFSSFLHGFNFQLSAVLLSLAFYAYGEFRLRHRLAERLSLCVEARRCRDGCEHQRKANACLARVMNLGFILLNILHLAYLGAPFVDGGGGEEGTAAATTGYAWRHTLAVWGRCYYASHFAALSTLVLSWAM